jgi:hypothetical protein
MYMDWEYFLPPKKDMLDIELTEDDIEWNKIHSALRFQRCERVNARLKRWNILYSTFRGDHLIHKMFFYVLAQLHNLEIIEHPMLNI